MDMNDLFNEKKQSPAGGPPCWKGKKIHPTKPTKMKGGKRVNNCIDAGTNEEVDQVDEKKYKAPTPAEIAADKKKDQRGKARPSITAKSTSNKVYKNYNEEVELDEAVKTKVYKSGKYWLVDVTSSKIDYTDWGPSGRGFDSEEDAQEFAKHIQKSVKESAELDEATDFRKGDTVHEVGSKLKGTVLHKGNRDEVVVKFGSINKSIPASQLRLVDELEEAAVCPQCGDPNCNCEPGTCDCEPVEESALDLSELRQLAGLSEADDSESCKACAGRGHKPAAGGMDRDCEKCDGTGKVANEKVGESYATAPYGDQEDTMVNYSKTKRMGDASVTVSANAKSMEELHQVLALAGLDPSAADKYAEPEEPCGCDDAEPEAEQPGPSTLNYRYETDKEKLIDIIKQRLQQKLS